jgi:CRISPR-associated protein (TIGR02710 family)
MEVSSMKTIVILTVGGSHQPIVRSIQQNRPEFVHFLCSADCERTKGSYIQVIGEGKVIKSRNDIEKPDLPNVVTLTNLTEGQYEVNQIKHFDNLNDCYLTALQLIEKLHVKHPEATIIADYTGGTKSMTAGLAAAALDDGRCEIQLVMGERRDLDKTANKTEFVRPVQVWDTQATRRMRATKELIARFDYAGAAHLLEETAARFASDSTIATMQRWLSLCRAFDAWDRFDHQMAQQILQPYRGVVDTYKTFLALLLEGRGHGFELVEDLLLNAERRAAQGRYDDAIGRLYRALELTAQVWLKQRHEVKTSDVDIVSVPESMKGQVEKKRDDKGTIKIGLLDSWDMTATFPNDPLGQHFTQQRDNLLNFLSFRNNTLFAHGLRPVTNSDYKNCAPLVAGFLKKAIASALSALSKKRIVTLPQLPAEWE